MKDTLQKIADDARRVAEDIAYLEDKPGKVTRTELRLVVRELANRLEGLFPPPVEKPCLGHSTNLDTIEEAAKAGQLALMECRDRITGEVVAVLCAVNFDGKEYNMVPFAPLLNGNPYERFAPPHEEGGFEEDV